MSKSAKTFEVIALAWNKRNSRFSTVISLHLTEEDAAFFVKQSKSARTQTGVPATEETHKLEGTQTYLEATHYTLPENKQTKKLKKILTSNYNHGIFTGIHPAEMNLSIANALAQRIEQRPIRVERGAGDDLINNINYPERKKAPLKNQLIY